MIDTRLKFERGMIQLSGYSTRSTLKAAIRDLAAEAQKYSPSVSEHILGNLDGYVYLAKHKITWAGNAHMVSADKIRGLREDDTRWYLEVLELPWVSGNEN